MCHDYFFFQMGCFFRRIDSQVVHMYRYTFHHWKRVPEEYSTRRIHQLPWRHNERDGVSNHQPHGCLLNDRFIQKQVNTSKLRVTGLCEGSPPVTGEFPARRTIDAENTSIWWRHHVETTEKYSTQQIHRNDSGSRSYSSGSAHWCFYSSKNQGESNGMWHQMFGLRNCLCNKRCL